MQKLFYKRLNSTKLKKLLGGLVLLWWFMVEWLLRAISMVLPEIGSLVDCHPGTKGFEVLQVKFASRAAICHMGSVLMD